MFNCTSINIIAGYISNRLRGPLLRALNTINSDVTEIRLNLGQPVSLIFPDRKGFLTLNNITYSFCNSSVLKCTNEDIKDTIDAITHFSFHSHTREFKLGYFVIEEGIRAGISGIYNSDGIITDITGVCFRISRTVIGCANELIKLLDNDKGLLICGGVNSGKTTILRDICRIIGNKYKVALIDERNEIATISEGKVCNDVGILTSIMSGCTRSVGIISSIRSLSPEYIICDEIADDSDTEALILGAGCGIKFIATVHANNYEALKERPFAKKILSSNLFSHAIFLSGAVKPGSICSVYEI